MFGRSRFDDVVRRQLDLFTIDESGLLEEAQEADDAWTNAEPAETEELYGDYQLAVDEIGERLFDVRESYASSLDERGAERYRSTFNRAAKRRFRRFAAFLED
jgi:NTP pyrophosphatase (non-canonical NTP hydrolase)